MGKYSRTEYSYLNILAGVGGYSVSVFLSMFNRMVFARTLPADYLGINGLFTNILSMLSLAELGIGGAIVYALYKPLAEDDHEKVASIVQLFGKAYTIVGSVIFVIGLCLMPFLTLIIGEHPEIPENLYLIFVLFLFNTASSYFFTYRSTLLTAAQQNYYNTGINYLVLAVQEVIQAVYLLLTHGYIGYLIMQVIGGLTYNVIISKIAIKKHPYIVYKSIKPLSKKESHKIFKDVRDLTIYKVSGLLVNSTDNILITFFNGLATTGIASNYTLLVNTLNSLLAQIFNGLTASIGNHNASEPVEKRYQMFNFLNLMNFWIFGWAALGIYFCSSDLVQLCFGEKYVLSNEIPFVMALNFFTVGMMNAVWTYKHTLGLFHYGRFIQFFTGILNIVFSVLLGTYWGLFGILFATFIARLFTSLWYDPYAVFKYGFQKSVSIYMKKIIKYLVILMCSAFLCHILFLFVSTGLIMRIWEKIILCSVVSNIIFWISFRKTAEFGMLKNFLSRIYQRLYKK